VYWFVGVARKFFFGVCDCVSRVFVACCYVLFWCVCVCLFVVRRLVLWCSVLGDSVSGILLCVWLSNWCFFCCWNEGDSVTLHCLGCCCLFVSVFLYDLLHFWVFFLLLNIFCFRFWCA